MEGIDDITKSVFEKNRKNLTVCMRDGFDFVYMHYFPLLRGMTLFIIVIVIDKLFARCC